MYFEIDENGSIRVCAQEPVRPGMVFMTPPAAFVPEELGDWRVTDGAFVYAPAPRPPQLPTQEERIAALERENGYLREALELLLCGTVEGAAQEEDVQDE